MRKAAGEAAQRRLATTPPPLPGGQAQGTPLAAQMMPIAPIDPAAVRQVNTEIGLTGLRYWYGRLDEEWLLDLKWPNNIKIYKEMGDNDATIGALFNAITLLCRSVPWRTIGDHLHDPRVEFLDGCRDDMSHSWNDFIASIMRGMLQYGWQFHEIVYKYRRPGTSQYADGQIGWKKLPVRSQDSFFRWEFAPDGGLQALTQLPPPVYRFFTIPIEKGLLFRTENIKDSPEGRSILRNAYRSYYFKKHIENIEAIGVERDLAGLPVMYAPARLFNSQNPGDLAVLTMLKEIVTNVKADEQAGLVIPLAYDEAGKELFRFELARTGGPRQVDTNQIIDRYDVRMLQLMMADFIHLGHGATGRGSYALSQTKTSLFGAAIGVYLDEIAAVLNRFAVPRLLEINGMETEDPPHFVHGDVETRDVKEFGAAIQALAAAGMPIFPNPRIEAKVLELLDLPTPPPEEQELKELAYDEMQDHTLDGDQQPPLPSASPAPPETGRMPGAVPTGPSSAATPVTAVPPKP